MKFKLSITIAVTLLLMSCGSKDATLTKNIVGEWRIIEIIAQDLSIPDSKIDTLGDEFKNVKWDFKHDQEGFVLHGTGITRKGTYNITDELLSFDLDDDFEMEKLKVYDIDDTYLTLGRKIEDVEYIRMKLKKLVIE